MGAKGTIITENLSGSSALQASLMVGDAVQNLAF
jgi:hypothetical protein